MKKIIPVVLAGLILHACMALGFVAGFSFTDKQLDTFFILLVVYGCSVLYCFIVGELANNYSQMDKLWSILPIAYAWIVAVRHGMTARLIIMAVLVTIWGIRLTANFARKGAYKLKFWSGEEDYRWIYLRSKKPLNNRLLWMVFDFFFICIFQNAIVLGMTLPVLAVAESAASLMWVDYIAMALALGFIIYEFIADEQQMKFQTKKWSMIREGKKLEELPEPYNLGFNTTGLWNYSRHPNYLGEQAFWVMLYLFVIGAAVTNYGVFNWSIIGTAALILLFTSSSKFTEKITASKYSRYAEYQSKVFKYAPLRKFR